MRVKNVSASKCPCPHLDQQPDHHVEVVAVDPYQVQVAAVQYPSLPSHLPHQVHQRPPSVHFSQPSRCVKCQKLPPAKEILKITCNNSQQLQDFHDGKQSALSIDSTIWQLDSKEMSCISIQHSQ